MDIIITLVLGVVAGWIASYLMSGSGSGVIMDIILGIVGAFVGGFLMSLIDQPGVTGFNLWSILVSVIGAIVVIYVGRLLSGRWQHA